MPRTQTQPAPALRIVVLEGEDAVNIIQQRTAVAPIVEVRDRNDQPVAGATVGAGLPLTAIGNVGAAVAGGTYVATSVTGNDPREAVYSGTFAAQFTVQTMQPNGASESGATQMAVTLR